MKRIVKKNTISESLKLAYKEGRRVSIWKGKKMPKKITDKMSATRKKIGSGKWMKGFKHSDETKEKLRKILANPSEKRLKYYATISQRMKGKRYALGYEYTQDQKLRHLTAIKRGKESNFWKGGISTYERKLWLNSQRRVTKIGNGGYHSLEDWQILKAQYNWTCLCCKKKEPDIKLTEDHIIPLSKGGSDNIENIQPLCKSCNSVKHNKHIKYEL